MSKTTSSESQARIRKEQAEQQANLAKQKAERETAQAEQLELFKSEIADNDRSMRAATEYLLKAVDLGATQRMAAEKVGKSESWVNRLLRWGRNGFKDTGPFSTDAKAKRVRTAKNIRRLKKAVEDKPRGIGDNGPPLDETPAAAPITEPMKTPELVPAAETPSVDEPPSNTGDAVEIAALPHAATNKPDDNCPLAEKLHYHLNDIWSLCQDQNNWPHLSADQQVQLRGAMTKLGYLRELLPRLATRVVH
jgi:hypothetical protein